MSDTAAIVLLCVCTFQSLLVFIGNTFTVLVFWLHRNKLKRSFLLLINLAVADLLFGFTQITLNVATYPLPRHIGQVNETSYGKIAFFFQNWFASASMFFLALISLERAFAFIWPFRHRASSTKTYIYSLIIVWLAGIILAAVIFSIYQFVSYIIVFSISTVVSLVTICVSYLSIRARLNGRGPAIDTAHNRQSVEQNTRLSKTIFVVIGASTAFWVPSLVLYHMYYFYPGLPAFGMYIFTMLTLANSLVNPIIYSLRIPVFKETLKRLKTRLRIRQQSKSYTVNNETRK